MAESYDRVTVITHPLVQHKLALLRNEQTPTKEFRSLVRELSILEGYEVTRDLPLTEVSVKTPIRDANCHIIEGKKVVIVPILRAGLGMVDGLLDIMPAAHVGHLGMYRDEETFQPVEYYAKLPDDIAERDVILTDPMLATGGSAVVSLKHLRDRGVDSIKLMVIVAAPQGIEAVLAADDKVQIYTCSIDESLNENAYIVPGLGDAGDRIFGTT